jgi:hypothetical protein
MGPEHSSCSIPTKIWWDFWNDLRVWWARICSSLVFYFKSELDIPIIPGKKKGIDNLEYASYDEWY